MNRNKTDILAALACAGFNRALAAKYLGIHPATIYRQLNKTRLQVPKSSRKTELRDIPLMAGLHQSGLSYRRIGEKFGISKNTVRYNVQQHQTRHGQ